MYGRTENLFDATVVLSCNVTRLMHEVKSWLSHSVSVITLLTVPLLRGMNLYRNRNEDNFAGKVWAVAHFGGMGMNDEGWLGSATAPWS